MADEVLSAVIRLEKQIQTELQQEQARADDWLAKVRAEQTELASQVEAQLAAEESRELAALRENAEQQAEALIEAERGYCRRLADLGDATLLQLLNRQLSKILPGEVDDHQDVEG